MLESRFFWLLIFALSSWLLYLLSPILTPFIIASLLAYLGDPLVDRFEKCHLSRTMSVILVFVIFIASFVLITLVLIPALTYQVEQLIARLPQYLTWVREHYGDTLERLFSVKHSSINPEKTQQLLQEQLANLTQFARKLLTSLKGPAGFIITLLSYLFLVPVVTFYLLRDWDVLIAKINELIPRPYQATVAELARRSDDVLGGFLRGQFLVMLGLGCIYAFGLSLFGLDMAIGIGMFAGLVSFVPYLGLIVGITIAGVMALLQFQDWVHLVYVCVVFTGAQMIEGTILTPKLVGDRTGLHPVAVLFSVLAGGQLFGFMGILLALPVAAVINVFLIYFKEHYLQSNVYLESTTKEKK